MNSWQLDEVLKSARRRKLDAVPVGMKTCLCKVDFGHHGFHYVRDQEIEASDAEAHELLKAGQVEIIAGGFCSTFQVKRIGLPGLMLYKLWMYDNEPRQQNQVGEFHDVPVRVKLLKPVMIIPGLFLPPPAEFFVPYGHLRGLSGIGLEGEPDWQSVLEICAEQE